MFIEQTDHHFDEMYVIPTPMITMHKDGKYHLINEYTLRNIQLAVARDKSTYEDFAKVTFTCQAGLTCTIMKDGRLSNPLSTLKIIGNLMSELLMVS
jgi:hypothetical protein